MTEVKINPEEEQRKEIWLKELANFIVEANQNTWAADAPEVIPERPGYKEPQPYKQGAWKMRDSYTGYFRAPRMTTVYYKDTPTWAMSYGGQGMVEEYYGETKKIFNFLKECLMKVSPDLPFRGPLNYSEEQLAYVFKIIEGGDISNCIWQEEIRADGILVFTQIGIAGIIIAKDKDNHPIYPWNL